MVNCYYGIGFQTYIDATFWKEDVTSIRRDVLSEIITFTLDQYSIPIWYCGAYISMYPLQFDSENSSVTVSKFLLFVSYLYQSFVFYFAYYMHSRKRIVDFSFLIEIRDPIHYQT